MSSVATFISASQLSKYSLVCVERCDFDICVERCDFDIYFTSLGSNLDGVLEVMSQVLCMMMFEEALRL